MDNASTTIDNWLWLWGFVYFGVGFIFHILCWRYFKRHRKVSILFVVLMLPVLGLIIFGQFRIENFPAIGLHLLLVLNYISVYPALQASSPSLVLMEQLWKVKKGLSKAEILELFSQKNILGERLKDLNQSGLVHVRKNQLSLTRFGNLIAGFFIIYRRLINLPLGAG